MNRTGHFSSQRDANCLEVASGDDAAALLVCAGANLNVHLLAVEAVGGREHHFVLSRQRRLVSELEGARLGVANEALLEIDVLARDGDLRNDARGLDGQAVEVLANLVNVYDEVGVVLLRRVGEEVELHLLAPEG